MSRISAKIPSLNKKGFTIFEVLLAIVLIAMGFVVLLDFTSIGLFSTGENESELVAIKLAQERIEELRNKSYANVVNEVKASIGGFPGYEREVVVTTPQTDLKQISVNVYWLSKSSELNTGIVTYVSNI